MKTKPRNKTGGWIILASLLCALARPALATTTVTVTSPNGGENWTAGGTYSVTWSISGTTTSINYQLVALSTDGGSTYNNIGSTQTPSSRSMSWTIPAGTSSSQVRIRVRALDINANILGQDTSDNIFTINNPSQPNLTPYQPSGWSDKIVVARTTGTTTDSTGLTTADTLYVNWAVINNGSAAATGTFYTYLYVDGVYKTYWTTASLSAGFYTYANNTSIGSLSAGNHTITITTDATGAIAESNEGDNSYTKTINVSNPAPTMTLNSPNAGATWQIGTSQTVGWSVSGDTSQISYFVVRLSTDNGVSYTDISAHLSAATRSFNYTPTSGQATTTAVCWVRAFNSGGAVLAAAISSGSFTITNPAQPNLAPYQNAGWSDKIVVARTASSTIDSTSLTTADTLYVNAVVINNGAAATTVNFNNEVFVDGVPTFNWVTVAPLNVNYISFLTTGYPIGQLSAGTHTITITADYGGVIAESNEGDNSYTKTISVSAALPDLVIQSITATPGTFHAGDTISVSCVVSNQGNATAAQTSTQLRFNQTAARPIGYENILTNFTTIAMGAGSAVVLNGQVTIPSSATPGTWYFWGIADNGAVLTQSGGDNDFTRSDPLTVASAAGQPNLTPYLEAGWSDKIVVARTASSTTDSTALTTADTLYVNAAIINNGTVATSVNFNNEFYVDGVPTYNWVTTAPLNVNYYTFLTTGHSIGQLSAGTHTITITADYGGVIAESNEGDNSYTKTISVGSPQGSPVSSSLSTLTAAPSSAPANGQSHITATVTLRNANNNPVAGKIVQVHSGGSVAISQPANPTDANGQATATITATAPVTTSIWAVDTTDSVVVQQQPTIQFTLAFVSPSPALNNAIVQLANSSSNLLSESIANLSITDGEYGDYFNTQVASDTRAQGINVLSAEIESLMKILLPGTSDPFYEVAKSIRDDVIVDDLGDILTAVAGDSTGLTMTGQGIAQNNKQLQQSEFQAEQNLLSGVLPATAGNIGAYTNDIALRISANTIFSNIISSQSQVLGSFYEDSEISHDNSDMLNDFFKGINYVTTFAGTLADSPKALDVGFGLSELPSTIAANLQNLGIDQQAYNSTAVSLANCSYLSGLIDANTKSAFTEISQGQLPAPIAGKILNANSVITYTPLSGITGDIGTWIGYALFNTEYVNVTGAYSLVTVSNSSSQSAPFMVSAFYEHVTTVQNQFGINTEGTPFPMTAFSIANIPANQSVQIRINYFDGTQGAIPDALPISLNVLGYDGNNGIFAGDQTSSTIQWQSQSGMTSNAKIKSNGATPSDDSTTNLYAIINPIKCFVTQNMSNQTFQATILIANPFAIPLFATVTQPLPSGITVLSTTGILGGSSIVWTNTIATNSIVEETFTFSLATIPGAQTNLPAAILVFSDATGTNTLSVQSIAPNFYGLFPVQVNGFVPKGVSGVDAPMQVTVTNFTGTSQTGSLNILITDSMGNTVTNFSQAFSVNGLAGTNLNFELPGTFLPGSYSLTGSLNMNGGNGQVLAGVYVVPVAPITLGFGSAKPLNTNGFNLTLLQAPLGSNCVVEFSPDLVNWTPFMYSTITNLPFNFNDSAATNYDRGFYRVVMP